MFFSAPGSHICLSPSLPLISKFSRHPSGMDGEIFIKHLVCDSTFPSGVSIRPLQPSASSCLLSHLTTNTLVPEKSTTVIWLAGVCLRNVACLWIDMLLVEVIIMCAYFRPHHLSCSSACLLIPCLVGWHLTFHISQPRQSAGVFFCKFLIDNIQPSGWLIFWRVKNMREQYFLPLDI